MLTSWQGNSKPDLLDISEPTDLSRVEKLREVLELSRCRIPPYAHQVIGIAKLVESPIVFLADEMGAGKTKQLIDAAMILFLRGIIDRVIIVAPAAVRSVWFDSELGELAKHLWSDVPNQVAEFHSKIRIWKHGPPSKTPLKWIVTNYDFIRDVARRKTLRAYCGPKTLFVLDESSAVKSTKSQQSKSCKKLREKCGRVVLMNGTPISNSVGDLRSQGDILSPKILECKTSAEFRARYAIMGGWQNKVVKKWQNLEDLQQRFAPYTLRRLKSQCLDLPEKMPSVILTATLSEKSWAMYRDMRDDLVAWLSSVDASQAAQAAVKVIRLQQITSGFIGGVKEVLVDDEIEEEPLLPSFMKMVDLDVPSKKRVQGPVAEIGKEKLELVLNWIQENLERDPNFKFLIWAKFVPEIHRLVREIQGKFIIPVGKIVGGQSGEDRDHAKRLLDPRTAPSGPAGVVGSAAAGGMGLTLVAASNVLYCSNDWSLKVRLQSEDRCHRPGQTKVVNYYDVVAVGPQGQKTIDQKILRSLLQKKEVADFTTSAWIDLLTDE